MRGYLCNTFICSLEPWIKPYRPEEKCSNETQLLLPREVSQKPTTEEKHKMWFPQDKWYSSLQHCGLFKDRMSHYKNTLPKVDGNKFVVPNHTHEGSWIRQFQTYVYMYKNRTKSEYNYLKVKEMSNLSTWGALCREDLYNLFHLTFVFHSPFNGKLAVLFIRACTHQQLTERLCYK